jgi:hypothetical protein
MFENCHNYQLVMPSTKYIFPDYFCHCFDMMKNIDTGLVLETGPGNPPAVWVWTRKTVWFSSRTVQKPDLLLLGGPNLYPYPSTHRFCRVWLDPLGPISGSHFQVFLIMVAFRYLTVQCKISTLVYHCLYLFYWLPL